MILSPPAPARQSPSPARQNSVPARQNSVLGKVRPILEAFTEHDDVLTLADLVDRTGVAKTTAHRLAQALVGWGVLERADAGYRLGLHLFVLGQRVPRQRILREAALPFLEELLLATQETIHLAVRDGLTVLYLEKLIVHRGLSGQSRIAGRLPLHSTATGKTILAYSGPGLLGEVVRAGLTPLTRHTLRSPALLARQLDRIRGGRLATEHEETRLGYASVAAPIFGVDGGLVAAVSVTAPTARINVDRLAGLLRRTATGVSGRLRTTTGGLGGW